MDTLTFPVAMFKSDPPPAPFKEWGPQALCKRAALSGFDLREPFHVRYDRISAAFIFEHTRHGGSTIQSGIYRPSEHPIKVPSGLRSGGRFGGVGHG